MQIMSTGLPYLIVPLASGLDGARVHGPGLEEQLASVGAKFVYVFDPAKREGRSWDNAGAVEDVATGGAAGPAAEALARCPWARRTRRNDRHQPGTVPRQAEHDRGDTR